MICAGCGFEIAPDFAFCPRCGRRLGAPAPADVAGAPEADRRVVSVLFADVSGFTAFSERLDPEDVQTFQTELHAVLSTAAERFGGFVEKFVGDAVMAVFGAPVAHEDDPERAVRAAVAMHDAVERLSEPWTRRLGRPVRLHVGINTGPVVAGQLGAGASAAYAVSGDTVNTASRLLGAAGAGETLASQSTVDRTHHAFAFEPLGPTPLKGKTGPLAVYRLLAARDVPRPARGLDAYGLTAPLIGRSDQLTQLDDAFEQALAGRAQVVSLIGEAGAGKSRLQAEFFSRLIERSRLSVTVRHVACSPLGEQTYGVLAGFLRDGYGIVPGDELDVARRKIAEGLTTPGVPDEEAVAIIPIVQYVLGLESADRVRHLEPEQLRRHIFLAARTLVERRLQQGPLVLVVDDVHWADAASVEILRFTVDRLHDRALMLLLASRPDFEARALVGGRVPHTTIRLAPLTATQSAVLLGRLFGPSADRLPPRLTELVVTRSGGNPFYVEEMVRGLIASGALVRDATGWTCATAVERLEIPATIQGLLLARLDRLPSGARRLLQEAAVLGGTFDERLLRQIASEPALFDSHIEVLKAAELMLESGAATEAQGRRLRFPHALVLDAVYQNLLVRRRIELHERAGGALEALVGTAPERLEDLEVLGHHWSLSRDPARGARYLVAAGDRARAIYANDDAIHHYERALGTLTACEGCDAERIAVRERIADLLALAGRREAALAHYDAVFAWHEAARDHAAQARLHRKRGSLFWQAGDRKRATASYEAGLRLLADDSEHVEIAHLCQELGRLAFRGGDTQSAIEWAERGLAHVARIEAGTGRAPHDGTLAAEIAAATAHAYNTLGVALARAGSVETAVSHIEESIRVAETHNLLQAACRGYTNLGVLQSTRAPGRAIETCERGLAIAKRIGDLGVQSCLYANLAVAYCTLTNRCDEQGVGAAEAAVALDRRLGQVDHLAVPLIVLGQIHQCHGAPDAALRYYREALGVAEEVGDPQLLFPCYDGLATLYLDLGDEMQAERYMQKAHDVCERAGLEPDSLVVLPFLS
jgi:predicted ATPase/class 3 adenylate cyclase